MSQFPSSSQVSSGSRNTSVSPNGDAKNPELSQSPSIPGLGEPQQLVSSAMSTSDFGCEDATCSPSQLPTPPASPVEPSPPILHATRDGPLEKEAEAHNDMDEDTPAYLKAVQAANDEWQRQNYLMQENQNIHHFNLLGEGVLCKNATPPAVSLFVSIYGAKAGFVTDKTATISTYGHAIMKASMKLVDPVIYHGPQEHLYKLRGNALREAVTGLCEKYFSEHGTWREDEYEEDEDVPSLDTMDVDAYPIYSVPANGWLENDAVMTREAIYGLADSLADWKYQVQQKSSIRKRACERKRSLLREVINIDEFDAAPEDEEFELAQTSNIVDAYGASGFARTTQDPIDQSRQAQISKEVDLTKPFDSKWTVDLDKIFGTKDAWDDDEEDENGLGDVEPTATISSYTSSEAESAAVNDPETTATSEDGSISSPPSVPAALFKALASSTSGSDENKTSNSSEGDRFSSIQKAINPITMQQSLLQIGAGADTLEKTGEGLTEEELQAEDLEIYGSSEIGSATSSSFTSSAGSKASSVDGTTSCNFFDHLPPNSESFAQGPPSTPLLFGSSFSMPIRVKPSIPAPVQQQFFSSAHQETGVNLFQHTFRMPIRTKTSSKPGTFIKSHSQVAGADKLNVDVSKPPTTKPDLQDSPSYNASQQPTQSTSAPSEVEKDDRDAHERMSPIGLEALDCTVMPLCPRKPRARRLTDSPSDLLELSSKAFSPVDSSSNLEKSPSKLSAEITSLLPSSEEDARGSPILSPGGMIEKFKAASSKESKSPSMSRSPAFADLKNVPSKLPRRQPSQRQTSLGSRADVEKAIGTKLPRSKLLAKPDRLEAISEADESKEAVASWEYGELSKDGSEEEDDSMADLETPPGSPVLSPYKRPASNTPRRVQGRRVRFDLLVTPESSESAMDVATPVKVEVEDNATATTSDSSHAFYALNNWSDIFGHFEEVTATQPASDLDTVPVLGCNPAADSSTATESPNNSSTDSSSASSVETGATTPEPPLKSVRDVKFIRTRPSTSTWAKVVDKVEQTSLSATSAISKVKKQAERKPKKTPKTIKGLFKSARKILRKGIQAFAGSGQAAV
jgi:hypothetical protein